MAYDSQIKRAKENVKLSHGGSAKDRYKAQINQLKLYVRAVVQLKRKP